MKAITVTADNRINPQLENRQIGAHVRFNEVPKKWIFENIQYFDFNERTDENDVLLSYLAGFRELVIEPITDTQKQGQIAWDETNDRFVIPAIDLTQAEIDTKLENESESQLEGNERNRFADGQDMAYQIFKDLAKKKRDGFFDMAGNFNETLYLNIKNGLYEALAPLQHGQFDLAKFRLDSILGLSGKALQVQNAVKQRINDYLSQ